MLPRFAPRFALLPFAALTLLAACTGAEQRQSVLDSLRRDSVAVEARAAAARAAADSARAAADTTVTAPPPVVERYRPLPPLARSIADAAVLAPRTQQWFIAAVRARRLLVDVGRLEGKVGTDAAWRRTFGEIVGEESPIAVGSTLRLRGPWGAENVRVTGFDVWHGRIVATLELSRSLDSLVRHRADAAGTAQRIATPPPGDSATVAQAMATAPVGTTTGARVGGGSPQATPAGKPAAPGPGPAVVGHDSAAAGCVRDTLPTVLLQRVALVRDSIVRWLTDSVKPPNPRLAKANRIEAWSAPGCFGQGKALVLASRRNATGELATERAVLVDSTGGVTRLRVLDLRFHAHEPLFVADVDGDGVDDLVARGYGVYSGGTTALRLDEPGRALRRVAAGFAWESR